MSIKLFDEFRHKTEIGLKFSIHYFELFCFLFVNNVVNIRMKAMQENSHTKGFELDN